MAAADKSCHLYADPDSGEKPSFHEPQNTKAAFGCKLAQNISYEE
jgi:hypothetical protein